MKQRIWILSFRFSYEKNPAKVKSSMLFLVFMCTTFVTLIYIDNVTWLT